MSSPLTLRFPPAHEAQKIFVNWSDNNPKAQVLVAPCGTKLGKSFGASLWLTKEALVNPNIFCVWIAPTYLKAKIGYRYIKAMLPDHPSIQCFDGKLEIRFANRSFIKFLHGKDAETTEEGEAIDRFVIDESGKQTKQLWFSLFTTLTQTGGLGIITGTPRGFTWYYDEFRKAQNGDPFYAWAQLGTHLSPYVKQRALDQAKRLLPKYLYDQYYLAQFVSMSTVFGDMAHMFDDSLQVKPSAKFWIHPDADARKLETVTGWDIAKSRDWSVFYTVNSLGKLVGYARMRNVNYDTQTDRLKHYLEHYFYGDKVLRYDATGVGSAVGEMIVEKDIDVCITPVTFTNKSKQEMVSKATIAMERGWHKAPRIEQIAHEFGTYEVKVTKSGLFTYSAPSGENDDVVSAALLAISGAFESSKTADAEEYFDKMMNSKYDENDEDDIYGMAADEFSDSPDEDDDDFFSDDEIDSADDSFDFNVED